MAKGKLGPATVFARSAPRKKWRRLVQTQTKSRAYREGRGSPNDQLPPTDKQIRAIARLCNANHIREPLEEYLATRAEARSLQYKLLQSLWGATQGE